MERNAQVTIVSAFGRGHWMAVEFAKANIPTLLLDVTDQLGIWSAEDCEGPFGFFKNDKFKGTLQERIISDDEFTEVEHGFSLLFKNGPLMLNGPLTQHRLSALGVSFKVQEAVLQGAPLGLNTDSFEKNWFANLMGSYNSTSFVDNVSGKEGLNSQIMSAPFYVRNVTRLGLKKSIDWCRSQNVEVPNNISILDIAIEGRNKIAGFEVKENRPGVIRAEQFIWCLSGEESKMLGPQIADKIYGDKIITPDWAWLRYRLKISKDFSDNSFMPIHFLYTSDIYLSWTHENLIIMQRTNSADFYDAWVRVPHVQRFNKQYISEIGSKIISKLKEKISESWIEIQDYPQEYIYTSDQLGPARHALFSKDNLKKVQKVNWKNCILNGPDTWTHLGLYGQVCSQERVISNILNWWKIKEELRIKKEQKQGIEKND